MSHQEHIAGGGRRRILVRGSAATSLHKRDHLIGPTGDLVEGLPVRHAVVPNEVAGVFGANEGAAPALVVAVVPFMGVWQNLRVAEPSQMSCPDGPLQRRGLHRVKLDSLKVPCRCDRLAFPVGSQWQIGEARVVAVA